MIKILKRIKKKFFQSAIGKDDYLNKLIRKGLVVGDNFSIQQGCIIDDDHCWHIKIGNNVTLAPRVHILAHDASSFRITGYTKVKKVIIGNNVFIGAGCIILPGVKIEDDVIIGAGITVYKDILEPGVYVGAELKKICTFKEYEERLKSQLADSRVFNSSYTLRNPSITNEMKLTMNSEIDKSTLIFVE